METFQDEDGNTTSNTNTNTNTTNSGERRGSGGHQQEDSMKIENGSASASASATVAAAAADSAAASASAASFAAATTADTSVGATGSPALNAPAAAPGHGEGAACAAAPAPASTTAGGAPTATASAMTQPFRMKLVQQTTRRNKSTAGGGHTGGGRRQRGSSRKRKLANLSLLSSSGSSESSSSCSSGSSSSDSDSEEEAAERAAAGHSGSRNSNDDIDININRARSSPATASADGRSSSSSDAGPMLGIRSNNLRAVGLGSGAVVGGSLSVGRGGVLGQQHQQEQLLPQNNYAATATTSTSNPTESSDNPHLSSGNGNGTKQQQLQNSSANKRGSATANGGGGGAATATAASESQPDGWRVKLYRLNADGSWDDCGTGRIVCLYRPPPPAPAPAPPSASPDSEQHQGTTTTASSSPSEQQEQQQQQPRNNNNGQSDGSSGPFQQQQQQQSSPSPSSSNNDDSSNSDNNNNNNSTDQWLYQETGEATLCVQAEVSKQTRQARVLLRTRILLRDAYQRQGDNIITWCEPYYNPQQQQGNAANGKGTTISESNAARNAAGGEGGSSVNVGGEANSSQQQQNTSGVDLALSFQDNAGCLDIWRQITHVQGRAADLLRRRQQQDKQQGGGGNSSSVEDMAARVAAQHHADLQRQQQDLWSPSSQQHLHPSDDHHNLLLRSSGYGGPDGNDLYSNPLLESHMQSLPNPPTLQNLEDIADTIAALQHVQQRESLAMWIAKDECAYLKALLGLFPAAEVRGDYGKLATLAACVKTILLLNDPSILELIVSVASMFEQVCSCLEYDPDLREKANHRWFLRERAKFRTVVPMEDPDLVEAIHRSFRVSYIRDTLLRPTMDESSLSTLSSLQTFTYADVVKGVTMAGNEPDGNLFDSYLIKVIDMLCVELHAISIAEWAELETSPAPAEQQQMDELRADPSIVVGKHSIGMSTWKQYLAPQDDSLISRRLRRRSCLSFLKELFNMVRLSLQQNDKDDFFSVICSLAIDLNEVGREIADNVSQTSQTVEVGSVASTVKSDRLDEKTEVPHSAIETSTPPPPTNLLSMLGSVLADPNTDISEKGAALEIIAGVVMHDPGLIRRHCVEYHSERKNRLAAKQGGGKEVSARPEPNEKNQVVFWSPANDLLSSLLFLLDVETDAGILLQVSEIMRIILDTDMVSDLGPMTAGFADEAEVIPPGSAGQILAHDKPSGVGPSSTDQKQFLSLFYEHYVEWLVAPFQFTILHPVRRVPDSLLLDTSDSPLLQQMMAAFQKGIAPDGPLLKTVPVCAVRCSFAVELLSFCVRAHLYRMKFFLLKSRVLGSVLKSLRRHPHGRGISGDRCLKLAALRFLRAILSVNDEFYHRHIIQHDLFDPVFEALRSNPVGDNLVSSAIVEMCDYIHSENVKSLIEYIVTRHLSASHPENTAPSLEDVSSPYVSTLTVLRKAYEANLNATRKAQTQSDGSSDREGPTSPGGSRYHHSARQLTGRALEDQRKFNEVDQEESYFESDDDGTAAEGRSPNGMTALPPAVDEVDAQQVVESELHRTPRMFSLAQAPLLNNLEENAVPTGNANANNIDGRPTTTDGGERETEAMATDSYGEGEELIT